MARLCHSRLREKALLRGSVKPTVVTPWSSHGMTEVKLNHATMPRENDTERLVILLKSYLSTNKFKAKGKKL